MDIIYHHSEPPNLDLRDPETSESEFYSNLPTFVVWTVTISSDVEGI